LRVDYKWGNVYVKSVNNFADLLIKGLFRDMVRKTTSEMELKLIIKDTGNRTQLRISKKLVSKSNG
jgi:hypothetical protein